MMLAPSEWPVKFLSVLYLTAFTVVDSRSEESDLDPETQEVATMSTEKRLISHLLNKYESQGKMGRPVINTMDNLTVYFGLCLVQILDIEESNQVLKTSMWYQYEWRDVLLQWEPSRNDNITSIRVPSSYIWLPDIFLYNFADDRLVEQRDALVVVNSSGNIIWMPQAIVKSSCIFDTKLFPFDTQICWLKFGSWTYSGLKVNIEFASQSSFDLSNYVMSNEWDIIGNTATRNVRYYTCCLDPYPDLTFQLTLKRKPAFYTYILLLPCGLLFMLTLVVFFVPPESPAKLQLGMSVFVAFFFLLLVLADSTPCGTASIPLIGVYFCLSMTLIALSTVLACVVAKMYFRGVCVKRAPSWMRCFIVHALASILSLDTPKPCAHSSNGISDEMNVLETLTMERPSSEANLKMAETRLLWKGGNFQTIVQQEMIDTNDRDSGYNHVPECETSSSLLDDVRAIKEQLIRRSERRRNEQQRNVYMREWRMIACVMDRIFLVLYFTINVVADVILFYGT